MNLIFKIILALVIILLTVFLLERTTSLDLGLSTELLGRFLRCDGTTAIFDNGSGFSDSARLETSVENSPRCGGNVQGLFKECRENTTILQTGLTS